MATGSSWRGRITGIAGVVLAVGFVFVAIGLSYAARGAPADIPGDAVPQSGHFGGYLGAVVVRAGGGDYVYLGQGSGFAVLDATDKSQPRPVGSLALIGDEITDIATWSTVMACSSWT